MVGGEWMRGKCFDMAVALHKTTKLPLMGLYDNSGVCHHAFVITTDGKGIDVRGLQTIDQLKNGCAGQEVRDLSINDLELKWVGRRLSPQEIRAAKSEINRNSAIKWAIQKVTYQKENSIDTGLDSEIFSDRSQSMSFRN